MFVPRYAAACAVAVLSAFPLAARAQSASPIRLALDATLAPQRIYSVRESMPAAPGAFTFAYPKWIPGYHGPTAPLEGVVSLRVSAGGKPLEWRRDLVDSYAIHTTVPAGASAVDVEFAVAGAPSRNGEEAPVSTSQLAVVEYSNFVMYPPGAGAYDLPVEASLALPPGWTFGTALPVAAENGSEITFKPAALYTLIDSPIVTGAHERAFDLGGGHELDAAADSAAGIALTPKFLTGMKHLVREGPALYGGKHYRDYHFLLSMSDDIEANGIEHHESSDNRAGERYASDDAVFSIFADLLPHEYSHSWNGKYRRPADLFPVDYQQPERTDLLWVYEGLNQYNGEKLSTRARLNSFSTELDTLAEAAASMDVESGRQWRPLRDVADAAALLYVAPGEYSALRRTAGDFYIEDDLIWLEADVTIRRLTHGARSLDDFCRLWGAGSDVADAPRPDTYELKDVIDLLNRTAPYDWSGFFAKRIDTVQPHAPFGGLEGGGYRLVYTDKQSPLQKAQDAQRKGAIDERYSVGMTIAADGTVRDVLTQSAAFHAGIAPGDKLLAVDGRKYAVDTLRDAIKAHKGLDAPMQIVESNGDFVKTVDVVARDGERYPHLERIPGTVDELAKIYAPTTFVPQPEPSVTPGA